MEVILGGFRGVIWGFFLGFLEFLGGRVFLFQGFFSYSSGFFRGFVAR